MDFAWRSVGEYLERVVAGGCAVNVIQLVGPGAVRIAAMGFARRPPTDREPADGRPCRYAVRRQPRVGV